MFTQYQVKRIGNILFVLLLLTAAVGIRPDPAQAAPASAAASTLLSAILGTAFTYQGQLKSGGSPVNGTCDFQFGLWDAESAGSPIGSTQTKSSVTVTNGLFTVSLDFGGSAFSGDARWLAIAVRCPTGSGDFVPLAPRQPLTAAPYALYAKAAPWSGLTGMPAGFADGVDNDTTYTAGTGLSLVGGQFSVAGSYRLPQACANGQVAVWNTATSTWICASTATGDITAVYAGTGLTGGGTSGDVTVSLNTTYTDGRYWSLTGNSGTTPGTNFLGTTNNVALDLRVNNARALRLEPNATSPNLIGGYSGNSVTSGVAGATIGSGGASGDTNRVTDNYGTVGGGSDNAASGSSATVGGGWSNAASGYSATVGGGWSNTASSDYATVGGGSANTASGYRATVPGGTSNTAAGGYSFAAGRRAKANNQGCFVWGDSTNSDVECSANNWWVARASGGVAFFTNSSLTSGSFLRPGGSAWNAVSNRDLKMNFAPVDSRALLEHLAGMEISTWNYKAQDASIRHIGPMADEFNALLDGLGGEGQDSINSLDADGVALAAIQGLYGIVQEKDAKIAALEARVAALEQGAGGSPAPLSTPWLWLALSIVALGGFAITRRQGGRQ